MTDRDPKPIDPRELGVASETRNLPQALRNTRGRVRWTIRSNSDEENRQLGIRNIQTILLEQTPELKRFVSEEGIILIPNEEKEAIEKIILDKYGQNSKFARLIGHTPLSEVSCPYFGSHAMALREALQPWGLNVFEGFVKKTDGQWVLPEGKKINSTDCTVEVLRDARRFVVWNVPSYTPEENEQLAITNFQGLFLERHPEFNQLFPRQSDGTIEESRRKDAVAYILENLGSKVQVERLAGSAIHAQRVVPAFQGSFPVAIRKSFEPWGLHFKLRDLGKIYWNKMSREEVLDTVRTIFLEEYPEFGETFLRNGISQITPEEATKAKKFILERLPSQGNFIALFGAPQSAQGFNDSYIQVIQEAFIAWGVYFNFKDFKHHQGIWVGKTREEVIEVCQDIFLEKFPEAQQLLQRKAEGLIGGNTLRDFILPRVNTRSKFLSIFPGTLIMRKSLFPYFGLSFKAAVKQIFHPCGIEFRETDFEHIKWTPELVEQEALLVYQQTGYLGGYKSLRKLGQGSLGAAIRAYPGGLKALKIKLGIADTEKGQRMITSPEEANRRLMDFFEEAQ